jgi:hypothetical protein
VLFALGYLIGVKVHHQELRSFGFMLHSATVVCLLGEITNKHILENYFA